MPLYAPYSLPVLRSLGTPSSDAREYALPIISLKELMVDLPRYDAWIASLPIAERERRARLAVRNLNHAKG